MENEKPTLFIDPVRNVTELLEKDGVWEPKEEDNTVFDDIVRQLTEGKAAKDELAVLKPVLAYALSKLPKKQLRVRAEDMDTIADSYAMQSKSDGQGGIILRSVKVL